MAGELQLQSKTGWDVYAIVRDFTGQVWNGSGWEAYVTANLGTYDIPMVEDGTASGFYLADFPAAITAATHGKPYSVFAYRRRGGSPAEGDPLLGVDEIAWKLDESGVVLADSAEHGGTAAVLTLLKVVVAASGNDPAISLIGSGSGAGLYCQGGSSGHGAYIEGLGGGHGLFAKAGGASGSGVLAQGSATSGTGLKCIGAGVGTDGYGIDAYSTDFVGFRCRGGGAYNDVAIDILDTLRNFYEVVTFGAVDDGSPSATSFDTDLPEATADHYKDMVIAFRDAPLTGQPRVISAYTFGAKGNITVGTAFTDAPGNGDKFVILGLVA
jgi:hypothetical protein